MMLRLLTAALAFAATQPARAEPTAAHFDPPLGREIRYEVVEQRYQSKRTLRFTLDERVVFTRNATGYEMAVRLHSAQSDAPQPIAQRFEGAFRPFMGMTTVLHLSSTGKPIGLADEAGLWRNIIAAVDRLRADPTLDPSVAQGIEAAFATISTMAPAERSAKLSEGAVKLLGYALVATSADEPIKTGSAANEASAQLLRTEDDQLIYALRTRQRLAAGTTLVGEGQAVLDRASGLLRSQEIRERLEMEAATGGQSAVSETSIRRIGGIGYLNTRFKCPGFT